MALTELYRSRPAKIDDDTIQVTIVYEDTSMTSGADYSTVLPAFAAALAVSGFSWSAFNTPRVAEVVVEPHYRAGAALVKVTYIGSRIWTT